VAFSGSLPNFRRVFKYFGTNTGFWSADRVAGEPWEMNIICPVPINQAISTMTTDYESIDAPAFGRSLRGFGINLLVRNVPDCCRFLERVCLFKTVRESKDYAILVDREQICQLHADPTYSSNPLPSLLPETGPRGGGVELRLYELDPDQAEARANAHGYTVLQPSANKPHGLRECYLLDPDGYCWVPSRPLAGGEE